MKRTEPDRGQFVQPYTTMQRDNVTTMRGTIRTISCLAVLAFATPALTQSATKIGQHNAWGTYSYQANNGKVCYVLTVPTEMQPPTLNHGEIYFFVSKKTGQKVTYEPQFIAS